MQRVPMLLCMMFILFLSACSMGEETIREEEVDPVAPSNDVEVIVKDIQYVLLDNDGTFHEDNEEQTIKVTIDLRNNMDETRDFYPDMDMVLIHNEGEIIEAKSPSKLPSGIDIAEFSQNPSVNSEEEKLFHALFNIEKDASYELEVTLPPANKVKIPFDLADYEMNIDEMTEPELAMETYLEQVVLGKEEIAEDVIDIHLENELQEAYQVFAEKMKKVIFYDVSEETIEALFEEYVPYVQENSVIDVKVIANTNAQAVVEIDYAALDQRKMLEKVLKQEKIFDGLTEEAFVEKVVEILPTTFEELEVKEAKEPMKITLEKKKSKWYIPERELDNKERLLRAFFAGGIY
ncbi:DUF5105 domain-containing protein [Pseudogracilibacillus sp. ICA-222130]|uniref:DUF5105 domain-containing protein n=1 Tax=Pseudogracilibacillus sp. ICA-222130 TaxID=3134655 RepID=UPI0030C3D738